MEQQLPWAQSPQTVLPLFAPHDPSVVTLPVAELDEPEVAAEMTGSCVEVVAMPLVSALLTGVDAPDTATDEIADDAIDDNETEIGAAAQPETQPFATRQ